MRIINNFNTKDCYCLDAYAYHYLIFTLSKVTNIEVFIENCILITDKSLKEGFLRTDLKGMTFSLIGSLCENSRLATEKERLMLNTSILAGKYVNISMYGKD